MDDSLNHMSGVEINKIDMNSIEINQISISNLEELQQFSIQTFIESFSEQNTKENMESYLASSFSEETLNKEMLNSGSEFYFVKLNGETVGYIKINFGDAQTEGSDPESLEIERIYVSKNFQGKNIGKTLFNKAVNIAKDRNLYSIWLGVWEENHKAIKFYQRLGFIQFNTHSFMLGDELQTDIMMKLNLE